MATEKKSSKKTKAKPLDRSVLSPKISAKAQIEGLDWSEELCFIDTLDTFDLCKIDSKFMSKAKQRLSHRFTKQMQTVAKNHRRKFELTTAHFFDSNFDLFIAVIIRRIA